VSALDDQLEVLRYLHRRIAGGDTRYCTIPTIRKHSGVGGSNQYLLALTDDLETSGFVITAAGINLIESGGRLTSADSAAWTGRFDLSEAQKDQVRAKLKEMKSVISSARLSNARTANAMALIESVEKLIETPDPLWPDVMRLLRSPTLAGVTGIASLMLSIVGILLSAASS
jgi:hypothetical protein